MARFVPSLALLATLALAGAAPAGAATVSVEGSTVTISAPARETNRMDVAPGRDGALTIRDPRTRVTAGTGCRQTRPYRVDCGTNITDLSADLGPFGDTISIRNRVGARATLRGGSGNDTIRGGMRGDIIIGNQGRDTVSYEGRVGDVFVTLGGGADDGAPGEGDDVIEVENARGGNGFDTLIGSEATNTLMGGPGDDRLDGAGGSDRIFGGQGNDLLQGGAGDDAFIADRVVDGSDALQGGDGRDRADYSRRAGNVIVDPDGFADDGDRPGETLTFTGGMPIRALIASPERDNVLPDVENVRSGAGADILSPSDSGGTLEGGPGTDVLYGGPGVDLLVGEVGFDRIVSRDVVRDSVRCGPEVDRVWLDLDDVINADCEQRSLTIVPRAVPVGRTLEEGGLRVRVECPPTAYVRCRGSLRATTVRRVKRRRTARLGLAAYGLVPGATQEVVIPFDTKARRIVARFAPMRVRVAIKGRDEAGAARPSSVRLVLRQQ